MKNEKLQRINEITIEKYSLILEVAASQSRLEEAIDERDREEIMRSAEEISSFLKEIEELEEEQASLRG